MSVEFFKDSADEKRWRITDEATPDGEPEMVHSCHEGFSTDAGALHNLFLNHAMMSAYVRGLAGSRTAVDRVQFDTGNDGKVWWKIDGANGECIGKSHKGFPTKVAAVDNLIVTYTMLAMFVALHAQERNSE